MFFKNLGKAHVPTYQPTPEHVLREMQRRQAELHRQITALTINEPEDPTLANLAAQVRLLEPVNGK